MIHGDVVTLDIAVRPSDLRLYLKGDGNSIADWSCSPDVAEALAKRLLDAAKQVREQSSVEL